MKQIMAFIALYQGCLDIILFSLLAVNLKFSDAQKSLTLTSDPPEPLCQGRVQFTCTGTEVPFVLHWVLNGSIAVYAFSSTHTYPFPLDPLPPTFPPGVVVNVTNAAVNSNVDDAIDITTILETSDLAALDHLSLNCEDSTGFSSEVFDIEVDFLGPAPPPQPKCILRSAVGGLEMVLQWSDEFNAEHVVERYNVRVIPDPASCTSDQVPPHQNYSCSGLDQVGANYSVFITAFNCASQEGEDATYDIQPQLFVPGLPRNIEIAVNSDEFSVSWIGPTATSGRCSFSGAVNYTVTLKDIDGRTVEQRSVGSDSCGNGICSIGVPTSSQICNISIMTTNEFGSSDNATARISLPRLTTSNQVLLALGIVLLCLAIAGVGVSLILVVTVKGFSRLKILVVLVSCEIILTVVASVLWVAVGFHVGLQDDSCDGDWQNSRDGLIISSFAISLIVLISAAICFIIGIGAFLSVTRLKTGKKSESEELKEDSKPSDLKPDGRVEKLEAPVVLADENRCIGETTQQGVARVGEGVYGEYSTLKDDPCNYDVTKHTSFPLAKVPPQNSHYSALGSAPTKEYAALQHKNGKAEGNPGIFTRFNDAYGRLQHPCTSMWQYRDAIVNSPTPEQVAAWFPDDRKWPMEDLYENGSDHFLTVHFMSSCPREWKYCGSKISPRVFMNILNTTWKRCFILGEQSKSHIRVTFGDDRITNWSDLGSIAKNTPKNRATMNLNFSDMNDEEIKATIVHQFGHALGLGHALMRPKVWEVLKPYLNIGMITTSISMEDFEVHWTGKGLDDNVVNYDEKSVMRYSTNSSWLKEEAMEDTNSLPKEVKKMLKIFHKHARFLKVEPSPKDLHTLDIGHLPLTLKNLFQLEDKAAKTQFCLTDALSSAWHAIGLKLGIREDILQYIKVARDNDMQRLGAVWTMWFEKSDEIANDEVYPFSWSGLRRLLADSGKKNIANEFFEYLDKL